MDYIKDAVRSFIILINWWLFQFGSGPITSLHLSICQCSPVNVIKFDNKICCSPFIYSSQMMMTIMNKFAHHFFKPLNFAFRELILVTTFWNSYYPASWGCWIYWLQHCRGVRPPPPNKSRRYDTKQSNGEVSVMLGIWGVQGTSS